MNALDPVDSTNYFFGMIPLAAHTTSWGNRAIFLNNCIIRGVAFTTVAVDNNGSDEDMSLYVRVNDTTDTLVKTVGIAAQVREFSNSALNIAIASGDFVEMKFVCPLWASNPAGVRGAGYLYIESA